MRDVRTFAKRLLRVKFSATKIEKSKMSITKNRSDEFEEEIRIEFENNQGFAELFT